MRPCDLELFMISQMICIFISTHNIMVSLMKSIFLFIKMFPNGFARSMG